MQYAGGISTAAEPPLSTCGNRDRTLAGDGRTDVAVGFYERSLAPDPNLVNNHLSLAAAYLDKDDDKQALPHLALYVAAKPNHFIVRAHYAELLLRLGEDHEAVAQYERFDADVQEHEDLAKQELVRCHSRLMEIAERLDDAYAHTCIAASAFICLPVKANKHGRTTKAFQRKVSFARRGIDAGPATTARGSPPVLVSVRGLVVRWAQRSAGFALSSRPKVLRCLVT